MFTKEQTVIPIETKDFAMVLKTDDQKRLWNIYFGKPLSNKSDYNKIDLQYNFQNANAGMYNSIYTPSGTWNISEPALRLKHADGNLSTDLQLVNYNSTQDGAVTLTSIVLTDPLYELNVTLFFKVWKELNVVEQWTEITNNEDGAITLYKKASANLYFTNKDFYLTHFQGEYLREMQPVEQQLSQGVKVVESKLGTRAMLLGSPNFILSFEDQARATEGNVLLGQLAWSGNYKLEFDIDSHQNLRFIAGINPYESSYTLQSGDSFKTPSLIYTLSNKGTDLASNQLQSWAKQYRVLDGQGDRLTLLNNWEATYFDFNEKKLSRLFEDTNELGLDLFLLDDGWFGNEHPRNNDDAGLGDWQVNRKKLPHGIGYLIKEADKNDVKFGIWIEPEMVNPSSDLFENKPEWVIKQPERPAKLYRNQMVLDMTNPEVQDFIFEIVDDLFTSNPKLSFIKWDCNAVIYNAYSEYLNQNDIDQTHLYINYVNGLYSVLERIRAKHPKVPMMLCSGGGGRVDYELLKYFTEFWPSDNTDPVERIFIQWNTSFFYPAITMDSHVTNWGTQPIKLKTDVASMGKLGFDIDLSHMSDNDIEFVKGAVKNYNSFKSIVLHGDQYRLASPYENPYASIINVNKDKSQAVMFNYLSSNRFMEQMTKRPIRLKGLNTNKNYTLKEVNLYPGTTSVIDHTKVYSGEFLMTVGINPVINTKRTSVVLLINETNK
jgi:alpha-galactosidase